MAVTRTERPSIDYVAASLRARGVDISDAELQDKVDSVRGSGGSDPVAQDLAAKTRALEYYNELMQQMAALEEQKRYRKTEKAESRYAQQKSGAAIESAGKGGKTRRVAAPNAQTEKSLEAMLQAILGISDGGGGEAAAPSAAPAATGGGSGGGGG